MIEKYLCFWLLVLCVNIQLTFSDKNDSVLTIVIDNMPLSIYENQKFYRNMETQSHRIQVEFASDHYRSIHVWTYIPLILRLEPNLASWFFIVEEDTSLNYSELLAFMDNKIASDIHFYGRGIKDTAPTIRHHFDGVNNGGFLAYPDIRSGFLISKATVERLSKQWKLSDKSQDFSIDAAYEFTKFATSQGVSFTPSNKFCVEQSAGCISWTKISRDCYKKSALNLSDVHFAVKTCNDMVNDRLPVLKKTWLPLVENVALYSDTNDSEFGTLSLGIPNTKSGHCGKTLAIIRHVADTLRTTKWLAIVDDDTLISPNRLVSLLSCFPETEPWAIGERYGFRTTQDHGFDYITGGGGMVFSYPLMKMLADPGSSCNCPSNDSPDDMFLGSCLQRLKIPIVHSSRFHQARPDDYPQSVLQDSFPISFHKFWMVDPLEIYERWLKEPPIHDEL